MANSIQESRALRDRAAGHNLAAPIPVPELISMQGQDVRSRFEVLENESQRTSFLDTIIDKLNSNFGNWAGFYEAVDVVRGHELYWREKGYATFDEFWKVSAGPSFRSFKELEDIYNFAKTACPELFNLDFDAACAWVNRLAQLRALVPRVAPASLPLKKRHYSDCDEAHAAVLQASKWYNAGGHSLEYRLARLKRDRPDIAAAVLAGRYFKSLPTGAIGIDLLAAELDAYGARPKTRRSGSRASGPKGPQQVVARIRAMAKSSAMRDSMVLELSRIGWLVRALVAMNRKKQSRK